MIRDATPLCVRFRSIDTGSSYPTRDKRKQNSCPLGTALDDTSACHDDPLHRRDDARRDVRAHSMCPSAPPDSRVEDDDADARIDR